MLVWVKEYIIKNFATCKSLCNLQELYTAFKEKDPNVNIGFSNFSALRPKWCVLAGSKTDHLVCVCSAHQNVSLLVDALDWDLTYKDLIKKIVCNTDGKKVQTMFFYYLKANHPHIYFSHSCGRQYKNYKNFMNLCSINKHFCKRFYFSKWMPY